MGTPPSALRVAAAYVFAAGVAACGNTGLAQGAVKTSRLLGQTTSSIIMQESLNALCAGGIVLLAGYLIARKAPLSIKLGCSVASAIGTFVPYAVAALSH